MSISIIHLSDLHYRQSWIEGHGIVLEAFFKDLIIQIDQLKDTDIYLAFSGDIVQASEANSVGLHI